jgi:hypothetical protein
MRLCHFTCVVWLGGLLVWPVSNPVLGSEPPAIREMKFSVEQTSHWAFQPIVRPPIPHSTNIEFNDPVDSFLEISLNSAKLQFAPGISKSDWLRRITWDLTGALPNIEDLDQFLLDSSKNCYEKKVDQLLASPHYGERMAQHWLDVVRFAETNGYELDGDRPHAWRFRDYLIDQFNRNKPFHQFLTEQIAGDELAPALVGPAANAAMIASGFNRCGPQHVVSGNIDPEVARQEVLTEMVTGVGSAFLGLTIHCARCHDHKFDPISQADYYRLEAFFAGTKFHDVDVGSTAEKLAFQAKLVSLSAQIAPFKSKVAAIDAPYRAKLREEKIASLPEPLRTAVRTEAKKRTPEQVKLAKEAEADIKITWEETVAAISAEDRKKRQALRDQQFILEAQLPLPPGVISTVRNDAKPVPTHILKRGDVKKKAAEVQPSYPSIFKVSKPGESSRLSRIDLAKWLTDPRHPLTARVFVNRVWKMHFGRGLVATMNDFGLHGAKPSHPQLLDWLASEFIASGWDIKQLHRQIVLSRAYRQQSGNDANPKAAQIDPENRLWGRMDKRRHEGETLRDAILTAAGRLNPEFGGPPIRIPLETEVYDLIFTEGEPDGLWPVTPDASQHDRRSIYLYMKRNVRLPIFEAFDLPDRLTPCGERNRSTFAPQALILINGPMSRDASRHFASRLLQEAGTNPEAIIDHAYRLTISRLPRAEEKLRCLAFLKSQTELLRQKLQQQQEIERPQNIPWQVDPAFATAVADLGLALFNTNEFVYVP